MSCLPKESNTCVHPEWTVEVAWAWWKETRNFEACATNLLKCLNAKCYNEQMKKEKVSQRSDTNSEVCIDTKTHIFWRNCKRISFSHWDKKCKFSWCKNFETIISIHLLKPRCICFKWPLHSWLQIIISQIMKLSFKNDCGPWKLMLRHISCASPWLCPLVASL